MIKKILIITLFYFLNIGQITIANESDSRSVLKDIKTRGSGGKIINIQPRKDINIFKSNLEKRLKLKNYTKLLSASLTKQPKRIQTRGGGGSIYSKFAKTVVYIGNYQNENVGSGFLIDTPY